MLEIYGMEYCIVNENRCCVLAELAAEFQQIGSGWSKMLWPVYARQVRSQYGIEE
jgi:hypothetical protein